jgi:CRP/FNR family transcriptional regulator, cyclic AMP receptor protein
MGLEPGQDVSNAIARSRLRRLPRELIDRLLEGAVLRVVAAGTSTHQENDPPFAELVVAGLIRTYLTAASGRTVTIRYSRSGALLGVATLFNPSTPRTHGNTSALVDSRILTLATATLRALAERDVRVAGALLAETSERAAEFIDELGASTFASLRQRVARHLLDLAAEQQAGPRLIARASQEDLAGAVGTVREIVVRILRDMREEGLVRTGRGEVELLDPARLDAETYTRRR